MPDRTTSHALRHVLRWCVDATIATGAAQVGGYAAAVARPDPDDCPADSIPATARPDPVVVSPLCWDAQQERRVQREAARGIAELEHFLQSQP